MESIYRNLIVKARVEVVINIKVNLEKRHSQEL